MGQPALANHLEFETLHDAHPLRIEACAGTSRRLMVSFASVGNQRNKAPKKEFVSSISQDGRNHVIAVGDFSRSWMNADGMARIIQDVLSDYILANGITQIMAIGTSMGAYSALVLGKLLPLDRVIAFTPQYSVHPDIMPNETRWWWFRKEIANWPYPEMKALPNAPTVIYMFHGDSSEEQMHWRRFPSASNLTHYIFAGADHNFVDRLKAGGTLRKIIHAAIQDRPERLAKVVRMAGGLKRAAYGDYAAAYNYFETGRTPLPR